MPPKKPAPRSDELFRSKLDNMIDMGCPLTRVGHEGSDRCCSDGADARDRRQSLHVGVLFCHRHDSLFQLPEFGTDRL